MPKIKMKEQATELPEMPERDEVGAAAARCVDIKTKIKSLVAGYGTACDALRDAMLKMKRSSITVEGVTFVLETKEAEEKVRAIWPK